MDNLIVLKSGFIYPLNTTIRPIYTEYLINEGLPPDPPFLIPPNQITQISSTYGPIMNDMSLMSIYPHMHLLEKIWSVMQ